MSTWKESEPSPVIRPKRQWTCGSVRIEELINGKFCTFHNGEPANLGTHYSSLSEAKEHVLAWAVNGIRQELDNLGIEYTIKRPQNPPKPACEHRCYTCGKPLSECAEERWATGK